MTKNEMKRDEWVKLDRALSRLREECEEQTAPARIEIDKAYEAAQWMSTPEEAQNAMRAADMVYDRATESVWEEYDRRVDGLLAAYDKLMDEIDAMP